MGIKSSNVATRVEPEIKERAEEILATAPESIDELTREEFDVKMARSLAQAEAGKGVPADEFFNALRQEVLNLYVG